MIQKTHTAAEIGLHVASTAVGGPLAKEDQRTTGAGLRSVLDSLTEKVSPVLNADFIRGSAKPEPGLAHAGLRLGQIKPGLDSRWRLLISAMGPDFSVQYAALDFKRNIDAIRRVLSPDEIKEIGALLEPASFSI